MTLHVCVHVSVACGPAPGARDDVPTALVANSIDTQYLREGRLCLVALLAATMTCAWLVRGPVSDPRALAGVLVENPNVQTRQNTVYAARICS